MPPLSRPEAPFPPKKGFWILMVDLATSHSTKLLSTSFTRETGIPIEFEFVRQSELLKRISQDVPPENYFDIYMYDVPWLDYLIQNGFCWISQILSRAEASTRKCLCREPEKLPPRAGLLRHSHYRRSADHVLPSGFI